ncbi:histidine kinase/DNA gyrase B/HSP90-like ATPase [Pontibacter ummariensis]|uniref:histidine kinase n=1 Tax=Pontibacter ummariensis TaxID=1610492 RepID=A0A239HND2_9BACT|nr:ATP-binding protein [Pontibacter ummariensis]PRY10339.1 histidine kinase/DNA gyrase B/HSP90-like ATPase [Pontibacter ummariensis]SNS82598.1 Histidine kinase-, DNA gyrase B-, and HSP90-like ATPase [Pontibacter ummariensis]
MIFKRLEFGLFVRFVLLLGMMYVTLHYLTQYTWLQITSGILVMLGQVWELAMYVTRSNNELAKFLQAVKQRDFSQRFNECTTNSSLRQLHVAFNLINDTYKQLHIEKEAQFQYMQTILQMIDSGIMAVDEETKEVEWVNEAFQKLLSLPYLKSIDSLAPRYPVLYEALTLIKAGESKLLKLKLQTGQSQLLLSATAFTMQRRHLLLIALKNVSATVDATETEAWQKLLRVMTHEIMNSVAPIASLADTLGRHLHLEREKCEQDPEATPDPELLQDTEEGISIIKKRSEGLLRFAHFYRNLNKSQELMMTTVYVQELFKSINGLMRPQLEEQGITLSCNVTPPNLTLNGDVNLLEQVLINLILNAKRAVQGRPEPKVTLTASRENGKTLIEVQDNGTGIPEELQESIFIPFFTSHKDGSGIGLSLAKHIMLLHKGSIQVESAEGVGTVFRLYF